MSERAVFTGIGIAAPNGLGTRAYWEATMAGVSGIGRYGQYEPSLHRAELAGLIDDFEPSQFLPSRLLPQTDRVTRLALTAADWALADAGLAESALGSYTDFEAGVVTSNASGGFEFTHTEMHKLWTQGPRHVSVYESFAWFYAVNTGQISIRNGLRGPSAVIVAEQAGGLDAIGQARRNLRRGAKMMVTGGMESSFDPWGWVNHLANGAVSTRPDPKTAYLPFDRDANGYVPGEGGAILILEQEETALRRGATTVYGCLAGFGTSFDPPVDSARPRNLATALASALDDAGIAAGAVDVVFADAAGIPALDRAEAHTLEQIFGPGAVPVTAPKAAVGRLYGGGGPLDVATALLSLQHNVIPETPHVTAVPEDYHLDLVREPRRADLEVAAVLARGRGGFNSAIILTR